MPNPENFTPHRTIRVPNDLWGSYGDAIGERERTEDLKAYMRWRVAHPDADLSQAPTLTRHHFHVTVTTDGDRRTVEVIPESNGGGRTGAELRAEIVKAITSWFKPSKG